MLFDIDFKQENIYLGYKWQNSKVEDPYLA